MADEIIVLDNNETVSKKQLDDLGLKRSAALEKLAAKKVASGKTDAQRKKQARKVQDGKIAALSTRKYCPFNFADQSKGIAFVPMTQKTAIKCGLKLVDQAFINVTADRRITGLRSVGLMKTKKIRVSYGMSFVDRKRATKGTKTGRTGRSRSVSKGLVRRWTVVSVPLSATNLDILNWIESSWKKIPQLMESGSYTFPLRSKQVATKTDSGSAIVATN